MGLAAQTPGLLFRDAQTCPVELGGTRESVQVPITPALDRGLNQVQDNLF